MSDCVVLFLGEYNKDKCDYLFIGFRNVSRGVAIADFNSLDALLRTFSS